MRSKKKFAIAATIAAIAVTLAACSSGTPADPAPAPSESSAGVSAEAQAALDAAFAGVGADLAELPPVEVTAGENLYVVSCGEQIPGCAVPAASVAEAAEIAGWDATVADGKLNPDGFAAAIRQGIAGGASIIVPIGIGCGVAQAAFQEAVDAGITIVGGGGTDDCEPKLWASERLWLEDFTPPQMWNEFGILAADYAFGKTDGDVKAVVLNFTSQVWGPWITEGFSGELETLGSGEVIETVDVSDPEVADGSMVQKVTTALLSQPDANVLVVPIDAWLTNGLAAALVQAGLDEQLTVIGRSGDAPALDLIRQGGSGIDATVGFAIRWGGWGSVDTALRIRADEEPQFIGESMQVIDAENNMPASGGYTGSVDFESVFQTAWGVG